MGLRKIFEKDGFRSLVLKSVLFVLLLGLVQVLIQPLSHFTPLPAIFKPFSLIYIEDTMLFVFAIFIVYNWKKLVDIKKYAFKVTDWLIFVPLGIMPVLMYYLLKFSLDITQFWFSYPLYFVVFKYFLLLSMVLYFALAVFGREMIEDMFMRYKRQMPFLALLAVLYWSISSLLESMWQVFSGVVAGLVAFLLKLSYSGVSVTPGVDGPALVAPGFVARIGSMCSGIESMLLFTVLFVIIVAVDFKKINIRKALAVFVPALLGVFLLNVLRIYLLYLVGINISRDIAVGMFHSNAGYVLFSLYFFAFLYYAYPWMMKKRKKR